MNNQFLTMFQIVNTPALNCSYRLLGIGGIPKGGKGNSDYDKNIGLVLKGVAYELKKPVALVNCSGEHFLAIPYNSPLPELKRPIVPHVAILTPSETKYDIKFDNLSSETLPIALQFLIYSFRSILMVDKRLWNAGHIYLWRRPVNYENSMRDIDIYDGFRFKVMNLGDGRLFLAIDLTYKYADPSWLTEIAPDEQTILNFENRHFIYHFGWKWYQIQFLHTTGVDIKHQEFQHARTGLITNVFDYTKADCNGNEPPWIRNLDPQSPAILYRDPGSGRQQYGAAALCKLLYATNHPRVKAIHSQSLVTPQRRFESVKRLIQTCFNNADLDGVRIALDTQPFQATSKVFPVPDLAFGNGKVLHVRRNSEDTGITLAELGEKRMRLLTDREAGPLVTSPFDPQYVIFPLSLQRSIVDDFGRRFGETIQQLYPQPYNPQRILYDDRERQTLQKQVESIEKALERAGVSNGYALLVLPFSADSDLHNYIKRKLWPHIQFQCATAGGILRFYEKLVTSEDNYRVNENLSGRLRSYTKYTALGLLQVNHKWLWALQTPLHYDIYIGIDVLKGTAGLTFIYNNGRQIFFRDFPSQHKERLSTRQMRHIIYEHLKEDLTRLFNPPLLCPHTIVIQRDGRTFFSELAGASQAANMLKHENILPGNAEIGLVEIPKYSSYPLRLCVGDSMQHIDNPTVGTWEIIDDKQGIICTTGKPFIRQGTANPLNVIVKEGNLRVDYVLEDTFALSQLIYSAPESCGRLPLSTRLSHEFLEPVAGEADIDEARYGEDDETEEVEEPEEIDQLQVRA